MKLSVTILVFVSLLIGATGCSRKSAVGFRLPDGDIEKGKKAFVELKCFTCHKVEGVETPAPVVVKRSPVVIGGQVARVKTYGELVTAIINPSHNIAADVKKEWEVDGKLSPMPDFNRLMTVEQMIDMVSFLQSRYEKLVPLYSYPYVF